MPEPVISFSGQKQNLCACVCVWVCACVHACVCVCVCVPWPQSLVSFSNSYAVHTMSSTLCSCLHSVPCVHRPGEMLESLCVRGELRQVLQR